jgi:hypothetical protein
MPNPRYDRDFYGWAFAQAARVRAGDELDRANVAEELESLGRTERKELVSHLKVILIHKLKWDHQPDKRSRSWQDSIATQRAEAAEVLRDNPSLKPQLRDAIAAAYRLAVPRAAGQTKLARKNFPKQCPYSVKEILG